MNGLDSLEEKGLSYFSLKGLNDICFGLEDMNFSRNNVQNFSALHHLPSECDISTIVAPHWTRPAPLKSRHPELSVHIKFEENRSQKGHQTTAQISGQKLEKRLMTWLIREEADTPMLAISFEGACNTTSLKFILIASRVKLMNYLIYLKVILFYIIIFTKKINKRRWNVESYFVDYSYLTFSLLIS